MSKNNSNFLKLLIVGGFLLFGVYTALVFAVPFSDKYNSSFWIGYILPGLSVITLLFFVMIALNNEGYNTDSYAKKVKCLGCIQIAISFLTGILVIVLNSTVNLKPYVSVVVCVAVFVVTLFLQITGILTNSNQE